MTHLSYELIYYFIHKNKLYLLTRICYVQNVKQKLKNGTILICNNADYKRRRVSSSDIVVSFNDYRLVCTSCRGVQTIVHVEGQVGPTFMFF